MIELLMVIMIVAILGAVALPQFLDFRREGKIAALRQTLAAFRVGIKNQQMNANLRCGGNNSYPLLIALRANDITITGSTCTTSQIPNAQDRKFVDVPGALGTVGDSNPVRNPFKDLSSGPFAITDIITGCVCASPCDAACTTTYAVSGTAGFHYCYDVITGNIWALSRTASEYAEFCAL